jgi:hypothetical protein
VCATVTVVQSAPSFVFVFCLPVFGFLFFLFIDMFPDLNSLCLIGSSFDLIQVEFSVPLKLYVEVCLCFDSAGELEHTPIVLCFVYFLAFCYIELVE